MEQVTNDVHDESEHVDDGLDAKLVRMVAVVDDEYAA